MTGEPIELPDEVKPVARKTGIFEHYCEFPGCTEWGGHGFGSKLRGQHFFCYAHKTEGEQYL